MIVEIYDLQEKKTKTVFNNVLRIKYDALGKDESVIVEGYGAINDLYKCYGNYEYKVALRSRIGFTPK